MKEEEDKKIKEGKREEVRASKKRRWKKEGRKEEVIEGGGR